MKKTIVAALVLLSGTVHAQHNAASAADLHTTVAVSPAVLFQNV